MTLEALHQKLQEAYNLENLNRISLTLLNLYKEKQFARLREITLITNEEKEEEELLVELQAIMDSLD